jgi:UDP-glucose 4-epimerase
MKNILVTGGAGFIGSHVCKILKEHNFNPITFDNLSEGNENLIKWGPFVHGDLRSKKDLKKVFNKFKIYSVMHLAAKTIVSESLENIYDYYENNVFGTLNLLEVMKEFDIKKIVFSSTCAIYGKAKSQKIDENCKFNPINVYGETKKINEEILQNFDKAFDFKFVSLRYFNACGADLNLQAGELRKNETHLIPLVFNSILKNKVFHIFGNDYNTYDGTCIRDYIHVNDIARAHFKSLKLLDRSNKSEFFNLGTGKGLSVLQVIKLIEKLTKKKIKYVFKNRRYGDPQKLVADSSKIKKELNFEYKYSNPQIIIQSAWDWFKKNNKLI